MTDTEPDYIDDTPRHRITEHIEGADAPTIRGTLGRFNIEPTEDNKTSVRAVFDELEADPDGSPLAAAEAAETAADGGPDGASTDASPGVDADERGSTDEGGDGPEETVAGDVHESDGSRAAHENAARSRDGDEADEAGDAGADTGAAGRRESEASDGATEDPDESDDAAEGDEGDEARPLKTDEDLIAAVDDLYVLGVDPERFPDDAEPPPDDADEAVREVCRQAADHDALAQYRVAEQVAMCTDYSAADAQDIIAECHTDGDLEAGTGVADLDIVDGGYAHRQKNRDGEVYHEQITNFTMTVRGRLDHPHDEWVIDATVHPSTDEDGYDVQVPTTAFNDPRAFKQAVVTGLTTTFDGRNEKLNLLREHLGGADAPEREGVTTFGVHADGAELVAPGGTLTADGWADDPETVYVSRGIGAEESCILSPERHDPDDVDREAVAEILHVLPQTRDPERFLPVLGWFYAAPTRPLVTEWTDEFNICTVMGDTGAGKSASIETLCRLFGMDGQAFSPEDTEYAMTATVSSTNALPLFYDEYKPTDIHRSALDRFHRHVRKSTRGGAEHRGRPDGSTRRYDLTAPIVIAGEETVAGPAEQRRAISTTFRARSAAPGTETAEAFARLAGGTVEAPDGSHDVVHHDGLAAHYTDHAVAYYTWLLGMDREDLRARWAGAGDRARDLLACAGLTGLDSMERQGLQTVAFGADLYRSFAETMGVTGDTVEAAFGSETIGSVDDGGAFDDALDDALVHVALQGGTVRPDVSVSVDRDDAGGETVDVTQDATRESHLDRFIDLCGRAAASGSLVEGQHYTFVNSGTSAEELRVNLRRTYDDVSRYKHGHDLDDELLGRDAYGERLADAATDPDSYVTHRSIPTEGVNRAFGIRVEDAAETIDGFERHDWTTSGAGGSKYQQMDATKAVACLVEDYTGGSDPETIATDEVVARALEHGISRQDTLEHLEALAAEGRLDRATTEDGSDAYRPRR